MVMLASYADILWARHAIFLPHVGEEDCVTSPKNVCVGGYGDASSATVRDLVSFYVVATDDTSSSSARTTSIRRKGNSMFREAAINTTACLTL